MLIIVGPLVETEGIDQNKVYAFFWATESDVSAVLLPNTEKMSKSIQTHGMNLKVTMAGILRVRKNTLWM